MSRITKHNVNGGSRPKHVVPNTTIPNWNVYFCFLSTTKISIPFVCFHTVGVFVAKRDWRYELSGLWWSAGRRNAPTSAGLFRRRKTGIDPLAFSVKRSIPFVCHAWMREYFFEGIRVFVFFSKFPRPNGGTRLRTIALSRWTRWMERVRDERTRAGMRGVAMDTGTGSVRRALKKKK